MKIAGVMAIANSPVWLKCLIALYPLCDVICLRFDLNMWRGEHWRVMKLPKVREVYFTKKKWNRWNWREDCLEMSNRLKPDIVLTPDQDEIFLDGVEKEFQAFWKSNRKAMMFSYHSPMPSENRHDPLNGKVYPSLRHMKAFKWKPGLTYFPYQGRGQISQYAHDGKLHWQAKTQILHYCMYDRESERLKKKWVMKEYGEF